MEGKEELQQVRWDKEKQARDIFSLYLQKSQIKKVIIWIALKFLLNDMNDFGNKTLQILFLLLTLCVCVSAHLGSAKPWWMRTGSAIFFSKSKSSDGKKRLKKEFSNILY